MSKLNGWIGTGGGGGNISGSGTVNAVAIFDGTNSITGNSAFQVNPSTKQVEINVDGNNGGLRIDTSGIGATQTNLFLSIGGTVKGSVSISDGGSVFFGSFGSALTLADATGVVIGSRTSYYSEYFRPTTGHIEINEGVVTILSEPTADKANGTAVEMTAGENVALGDVCYMKSDGKLWKADATTTATTPGIAIALGTITADNIGLFLLNGRVFLSTLAPSWTVGGFVYLSTTAGGMTQTQPTGTGKVVQILGIALTASALLFNPQLVQVELA